MFVPSRILALISFALIIVACALLPGRAAAAPGWQVVLDRPTASFGPADFVSDSEGWMAAGAGLLHTTDGGATWTENAPLTGAVDFADSNHGWLIGPGGVIYHTTDGGAPLADGGFSWQAQQSGTDIHLSDVFAVSAQEAWAVGYGQGYSDVIPPEQPTVLLHTTDGGTTWQHVETPAHAWFGEITFAGQSGWALGGRCTDLPTPETPYCSGGSTVALLRTTDGGATWSLVDTSLPTSAHALTFASETNGWLVADACITGTDVCNTGVYRTTDGGTTWQSTNSFDNALLRGLAFQDENHGWLVTQDCLSGAGAACHITDVTGRLWRTDDGGVTWQDQSQFRVPSETQGVAGLSLHGDTLYITGGGIAYRSTDGGASATPMDTPALTLDSLSFVDAKDGYVLSKGDIMRTSDSGRTWRRAGLAPDHISLIKFLDVDTGLAAGQSCRPEGCAAAVQRTTDGGVTWSEVVRVPGDEHRSVYPHKIEFVDKMHGFVVFDSDLVLTSNGGATWTTSELPPNQYFADADLSAAGQVWAVVSTSTATSSYQLGRSDDGGATWTSVRPLANGEHVTFVDSDHGWYTQTVCAQTCDLQLFRTRDGGATWEQVETGLSYSISSAFVDKNNAWLDGPVCVEGACTDKVLHSVDGGSTWSEELSGGSLMGTFEFVDASAGWLALSPYRGYGIGGGPPNRTVLYSWTGTKLPDVGAGSTPTPGSPLLPLVLGAAGAIAFTAAFASRRRRT